MNNQNTFVVEGRQPVKGQVVEIGSGLGIPFYTHVDISATSGTIDHYVFKNKNVTVATLDLTYSDSTHSYLTTVDRTS